jgi:prophage regulatory protein
MADSTLNIRMLRPKAGAGKCGWGRSSYYANIKAGLMVRPVAIGPRAKATPEHEIDAVLAARLAGQSDEEVRSLVKALEAARSA